MIKRLDLINFQSHKNTSIEFSEGVNTIIGPSDSGKTAILRALQWAVTNRPLGDSFIRHGEDQTTVMVGLSEGAVVERAKGKNDHYRIHQDPGEVLEFKAFGTDVPEEVQEAFRFDEINFQGQMDSAFLLTANSGEVSRHFNKIANIERIDSSLKAVERWLRSLSQGIKNTEEQIEEREIALADLAYLDRMEVDVEAYEKLEESRNKIQRQISAITKTIKAIEETQKKIESLQKTVKLEKPVRALLATHEDRLAALKDIDDLKQLLVKIFGIRKLIKEKKRTTALRPHVDSLLESHKDKEILERKHEQLQSTINSLEDTNQEMESARSQLAKLEEDFHNEFPEVCPLCEQEVEWQD